LRSVYKLSQDDAVSCVTAMHSIIPRRDGIGAENTCVPENIPDIFNCNLKTNYYHSDGTRDDIEKHVNALSNPITSLSVIGCLHDPANVQH